MIQEIEPKHYDPAFRLQQPKDGDFVLHYEYNKPALLPRIKYSGL